MTDTTSRQTGELLGTLLHAGEAWRNWRALLALCATAALAVLVLGVGSAGAARGNILLTLFASFVAIGVLLTGVSTAGVLLMDQAAGAVQRELRAALTDGLFCALRFVLLGVGAVVLTALYGLAVSLVLFLCKIPGLGPVLYAILFPLLALASAFYLAACYLFFLLAGPALWSGASLRQTLARLYTLILRKPVQAAIAALMLSLLVFVAGFVLFGVASSGVFFVTGLSAAILDFGPAFGPMMSHGAAGMGGSALAGMMGAGLVYALVGAAVFAVMIHGSCGIYRHLTADLDFSEAEATLDEGMRRTREKAAQLRQEAERRARDAQEEVRRRAGAARAAVAERGTGRQTPDDPAPPPAASDAPDEAPGTEAEAAACPACGAAVGPQDAFCGQCGHRLTASS